MFRWRIEAVCKGGLFRFQARVSPLLNLTPTYQDWPAYAFGIAKNHPFVDGNKRTALVACRTFLLLNGFQLNSTAGEKYLTFLFLAEGSISEEELTAWLREKVVLAKA